MPAVFYGFIMGKKPRLGKFCPRLPKPEADCVHDARSTALKIFLEIPKKPLDKEKVVLTFKVQGHIRIIGQGVGSFVQGSQNQRRIAFMMPEAPH
jgi:hypothetical protein